MTLAVAIRISDFRESPERAVRSVLAHKDRISELHFIHPTYREGDELYPGWLQNDAVKLGPILVHFDATLNGANFGPQVTQVIELAPSTELCLGAFEQVKQLTKSAQIHQNHIAISTGTIFRGLVNPWYGFAVVMTVIDWIWNRTIGWNRLIQSNDIHVRFLMRKGKRAFLPEPTFSSIYPRQYGANVARTQPDSVLWLLNTHSNLKLGWWIVLFSPIWLFLTLSWVSVVSGAIFAQSLVLGSWVGSAWMVQSLMAHLICANYLQMPYAWVYHLLFPAYFAAFPFYLIYSRLYIPQRK